MKRIVLVLGLLGVALIALAQNRWDYHGNPNWDRSWNDRPFPKEGACFLKIRASVEIDFV
jgi:hypothetical protein